MRHKSANRSASTRGSLLSTVVFPAVFGIVLVIDLISSAQALASTDWSQPPVACVEDIVPEQPNRDCLDLSAVIDPLKDWPSLAPAESLYWHSRKRPIQYCRALEVLRRSAAQPGSQTAGQVENAWMQSIAVNHRKEKIAAVYEASRVNRIPAQVLTGALYQESLFSELGIAEDGANYSCGVGQINLVEWCHWADNANPQTKQAIGWPNVGLDCSDLTPGLIAPFFAIAQTRLGGLPDYRLRKEHFADISLADVRASFPAGAPDQQQRRFEAARSFINNCSDPARGIAAKASELASLYNRYVPAGLKTKDIYPVGERLALRCQAVGYEGAYPLNSGWLLAVGMYNAGPRALDQLAFYRGWRPADLTSAATFKDFKATDLIEAFYWGGRYSERDDLIHLVNLSGNEVGWTWMKPCVLQRHIARVIQHATAVNAPVLADSLEAGYKCAKSVFDSSTGSLISSAVPTLRQKSSGQLSRSPYP